MDRVDAPGEGPPPEHRHEVPIVCDPYHCFVHLQWPASVLVASITGGVALVVFLAFAI